ncbi:MAG TPA: hypothetical protein DEF41_02895 [Desulfovibrio sp.]|uniref:Uncharacterized protein n=1 Tax=Nitratidesulfovibrio vulgaris (strain ATCC 29579 / DSM 644 / CCUG 34227 / NCIMB 8303 / VKM B-1760 / Hildenborough) TaxID=882 RepID=Q726E4_NITV2|nr:hypothetical protein DVU_3209 [Nitratidesulfovibrio vulgaris str. Hildenborough]HBW15095.1 hypothetical protein [Desulfovibrio sp.]
MRPHLKQRDARRKTGAPLYGNIRYGVNHALL